MVAVALFGLQCTVNLDAVTIQKKKSSTRNKAMQAISNQEKAIRRELHELLSKKPVNTLTLADVKRVRFLFKDLHKINRDLYDDLYRQYMDMESCCSELSPFEIQETKLLVTDLLHKGKGSLSNEQHEKVIDLLSTMYDVTRSGIGMCYSGDAGDDDEAREKDIENSLKKELKDMGYYELTHLYRRVTGKEFRPVAKGWDRVI